MMMKKLSCFMGAMILAGFLRCPIFAEDIEKKFTLFALLNNYTTSDEINSDASNRAYYIRGGYLEAVRPDPRPDNASSNSLKIQDAYQMMFGANYGITSWFLIEASIGYSKSDVGDLEVCVRFEDEVDPEAAKLYQDKNEHLFRLYLLPVGELTRVPIQTSGIIRFRPKSNFNPYIGAGIGFIMVEFDSSSELDQFSSRIDRSIGTFMSAYQSEYLNRDLGPVTVEAPDSLEYHVAGGFDYTFKKHWAIFMDAKYVFASKRMSVKVDGVEKFGRGFPNLEVEDWETVPPIYGEPYGISSGGAFDFNGDGILDGGMYYVNGGNIKYGGFSLGVGIKYTF
ncbi:MAG: OmpW family outer membrane protein [Acidobacteriota bacterium]